MRRVNPGDAKFLEAANEDVEAAHSLSAIALDALAIFPPRYCSSIFGSPTTWIPPFERFSEFQVGNLWRLFRTLRTAINWTVPSIPLAPPPFGPPFLNEVFFQPSVILQRPDHNGGYTSFLDEQWFFVNGIMTNDEIAQLNAAFIAQLFHRPVTLIQNSTDSLLIDLWQCAMGKQWKRMTEPAIVAFPAIYDALVDPHKRRVVVIAHSQGTIIMSNVLRWLDEVGKRTRSTRARATTLELAPRRHAPPEMVYPDPTELDLNDFEPLTAEQLAKLEVCCFATCANVMTYFAARSGDGRPLPLLEHFGNENDVVARLGMQAPNARRHGIAIDGPRYVRPGAWGHLLNEHYLFGIEEHQRQGRRKTPRGGSAPYVELDGNGDRDRTPRLFGYINGGTPDDRSVK